MTESAYPSTPSIPIETLKALGGEDELNYTPSTVEDMRPTQEFKDKIDQVIRMRSYDRSLRCKPLSEHLDLVLGNSGIIR